MRKLLPLLLLFPASVFAQGQGTHYAELGLWFEKSIRESIINNPDTFLGVGWKIWELIAGLTFTMFLIRTARSARSGELFDFEGITALLGKMLASALMLTMYVPLIHTMDGFFHGLAVTVGAGETNALIIQTDAITAALKQPDAASWNFAAQISVALTRVFIEAQIDFWMAIIMGILFLMNNGAYVYLGIAVVFGPLAIPFVMTQSQAGRFYRWLDLYVAYSMLPVTLLVLGDTWTRFLMYTFDQLILHDISLPNFLIVLPTVAAMTLGFLAAGLHVSSFNAELFGSGYSAGSLASTGEAYLRRLGRRPK